MAIENVFKGPAVEKHYTKRELVCWMDETLTRENNREMGGESAGIVGTMSGRRSGKWAKMIGNMKLIQGLYGQETGNTTEEAWESQGSA